MDKVIILKKYDRKFRIPLYDILGAKLLEQNIQFEIIYGQPDKDESQTIKDVITENRWGQYIQNKYLYIGKLSICWQPVWRYAKKADLIIIQQSNRLLINYLIQFRRIFFKKPIIAFWGHGMNFQAKNKNSIQEKFKAFYSNHIDYWFAYNDLSKKVMIKRGFNQQKIFSLQNTIDAKDEMRLFESIPDKSLTALRNELKIGIDDTVGIYCGSLYAHKRIEFLIQTLIKIRERYGRFHFIIIGDGILKPKLLELISGNETWIHYLGSKFGEDKLQYFKMASFQLIPGLVGLNIIDSFITLTPLITTENELHSPEISYLQNYKNGIITDNTLESYSEAIFRVLEDKSLLERLKEGCEKDRKIYTIENMANKFYQGIVEILNN